MWPGKGRVEWPRRRPGLVGRCVMFCDLMLLAALIGAGQDRAAKEPSYKLDIHKAEDKIVVRKEKDRTVFVVTSPSGIGIATIALEKGEWPEKVTLRFLYREGNGFDMLEDLQFVTDRLSGSGSAKQSGKM